MSRITGCRRVVVAGAVPIKAKPQNQLNSISERPELKILYRNLKFGQNKSFRGRKDLQL
jgi:hypothetical protein